MEIRIGGELQKLKIGLEKIRKEKDLGMGEVLLFIRLKSVGGRTESSFLCDFMSSAFITNFPHRIHVIHSS